LQGPHHSAWKSTQETPREARERNSASEETSWGLEKPGPDGPPPPPPGGPPPGAAEKSEVKKEAIVF